jgi:RNA polymerase nonessential primary-like sigma factor
MRYGIDVEEPMSLTGIAKTLRMSRDRTRKLERQGLAHLRSLPVQLEAYLAA